METRVSDKIVFVSDTHFGCSRYSIVDTKTGLPSRLLDYQRSFAQVVDYAINNDIKTIFHCGDVFHRNIPTPTEEVSLLTELQKLEDAKINTHIINGNHDYNYSSGRSHATGVIKAAPWNHIHVWDNPGIVTANNIDFHLIPYPHPLKLIETPPTYSYKKVILCHAHFSGATVGAESFMVAGGVPETTGIEGVELIISGHIHKHQEIKRTNYKIVYVGSMERSDFAERDEVKGFLVLNPEDLSYEQIPIKTREFVQFNFNSPSEVKVDRDVTDKIVKVRIKCKESEVKMIDISSLRESLKSAHFISSIEREVEREKRVRSETITEKISPADAFKQYLDLKNPSNRQLIEKLGTKIIEGVSQECVV